jgi:hypothetical protein
VTTTQTILFVVTPIMLVFGVCFIVFHQHISDMARQIRREQGRYVGPQTQSPGLMLIVGLLLVLLAGGAAVGAISGFFG